MKSPFVIFVGNEKGGAGKTTTAYNLAVALIMIGYHVVLIDNDAQKGSTRWKRESAGYISPVVANIENPLEKADIDVFSNVDFVIIDGSPGFGDDMRLRKCHEFLNELIYSDSLDDGVKVAIKTKTRKIFGFDGTITAKMAAAIRLSDFVIVPTLASHQDLEPAISLVRQLIIPAQLANKNLKYRLLLNNGRDTTRLHNQTMEYFKNNDLDVFEHSIAHREIYRTSAANGFTVLEVLENTKATNEVRGFVNELLTIIGVEESESTRLEYV